MSYLCDGWRRLALTAVASLLLASGCGASSAERRPGRHLILSLEALEGGRIESANYRGTPLLLHVFSTWDPSVSFDVELFRQLHEESGDNLKIIGIALNPEGYSMIAPWRRAMKLPYLIALADEPLRSGRSAIGPLKQQLTTLLLDRKGRLLRRWDGPVNEVELRQALTELRVL